MLQTRCPICSAPPLRPAKPLRLVTCESCGVSWSFIPEEIDATNLYTDETYSLVDNRKSVFERIIFYEAGRVLRLARKLRPRGSRLLDFGCGKGQFLVVARERKWEGFGIETEPSRAAFATEKYGVKALCETYTGGRIEEKDSDLITLNHVLEHLPQPMQLLRLLVGNNLKSDGLLYIEVPRLDSWQAAIAGSHWMHLDIPRHLTHWTEPILRQQLSLVDLPAVATRSFSIHLGVLGMAQALLWRLGYRRNIISELKHKKSIGSLLTIALVLPLALILECTATMMGKSGIIGLYCRNEAPGYLHGGSDPSVKSSSISSFEL
jgi:2-polyprenyl-3-methyl-5-hydroxy-6-metoxy-1,4-benzoquinol methylase